MRYIVSKIETNFGGHWVSHQTLNWTRLKKGNSLNTKRSETPLMLKWTKKGSESSFSVNVKKTGCFFTWFTSWSGFGSFKEDSSVKTPLIVDLETWILLITSTHSLQRIHRWASDVMLNFCWRNKLIYILDGLRVSKFLANFWNIFSDIAVTAKECNFFRK